MITRVPVLSLYPDLSVEHMFSWTLLCDISYILKQKPTYCNLLQFLRIPSRIGITSLWQYHHLLRAVTMSTGTFESGLQESLALSIFYFGVPGICSLCIASALLYVFMAHLHIYLFSLCCTFRIGEGWFFFSFLCRWWIDAMNYKIVLLFIFLLN